MRVSKSFLTDYVDITDIDYKALADKMVFAGNEFESIERISSATGVLVGEVIECVNHPESTKLHICKVNIGNEVKQIVCGAPNVSQGKKVMVATIGAKLPGGIEIRKAKLAGTDSEGMICSLGELGIPSKYLTEEDKTGIHVLNDDAPVGEDAIKYLGYDDEVIDFELTSNRADLLSYLGMAYEVGAIYKKDVKYPEDNCTESNEDINTNYTLEVRTDNCSIYTAKLVKNVVIKESPNFIKSRLMANGIRPINNVVDISNYVMLEYGQPLHFFDASRLGNKIIVRMANNGEKITTLDGIERELNDTDIVIANEKEAVALAGVMGGLSTEVENDTNNILIESAIFNPYNIRYTSKKILRSEASNRYEKGVDPSHTIKALKRACYLLNKYAGGIVTSNILSHDTTDKNDKEINITVDKINRVLGMQLKSEEIIGVFDSLKFKTELNGNSIKVLVPTRRLDINIEEDLIEEVGRIYGYDNLEGCLPKLAIKPGKRSYKATMIKNIREKLESLGLNEVITYSLLGENDINKFTSEEFESIKLIDPMSEDRCMMRNSLITSLLNVWEYNNSRNIKDINIFEIGRTYYKNDEEYIEDTKVSGLIYGNYLTNKWQGSIIKSDFYVLKGIIEQLFDYLGLKNRYDFVTDNLLSDLHPTRSAAIIIEREVVGYIGQVHPSINKKPIYVFELNLDKLISKKVRSIKFKEVSKYPTISKDMAFVVNKKTSSKNILSIIKHIGGKLLIDIDVFDVYVGDNLNHDEKSIAYSLTFGDMTRTLLDDEVNNIFRKIIEEVETKTGAKLRDK